MCRAGERNEWQRRPHGDLDGGHARIRDHGCPHILGVRSPETARDALPRAHLAVRKTPVGVGCVPRAFARTGNQGVAHVQVESKLNDTEEERRQQQATDEDEVDGCRTPVIAMEHGQGVRPPTALTALLKTLPKSGLATPNNATTSAAVMIVTSTHPGTSPRSTLSRTCN